LRIKKIVSSYIRYLCRITVFQSLIYIEYFLMSLWKIQESFDHIDIDIDARLSTKPDFKQVDRSPLALPSNTPPVAIAVFIAGQLHAFCLAIFSYYSLKEGLNNANLAETLPIEGAQLIKASENLRDAALTNAVRKLGPAFYSLRRFSEVSGKGGGAKEFATAFGTLTNMDNYRARTKQKYGNEFTELVDALWLISKSSASDKKPPTSEKEPVGANNLVHVFKWAAIGVVYHLSGDAASAYRNYAAANLAAFKYQT